MTSKGVKMDDFYVMEYPTWINIIARTKEGKYLIERQYRHGIQETHYELCAGTCEADESPLESAKRELKEETGYGGGTWTLFGKYAPNPNSMSNWCYTYLADSIEQLDSPQQELTEDIEIVEVTKEELLDLMQTEQIIEGIMLAPLWQYFYQNK